MDNGKRQDKCRLKTLKVDIVERKLIAEQKDT